MAKHNNETTPMSRSDPFFAIGNNNIEIDATYGGGAGTVAAQRFNVSVAGGVAKGFTYDNNGNCITSGSTTYVWDAENRLVSILYGGAARTDFTYDGFGRRAKCVETPASGNPVTHYYVWSGASLREERDVNNNVTRRFYSEGEQVGTLVNGTMSYNNYYYTRDHLGSVREITDSSGTKVARYNYDPYGRGSVNLITTGAVEASFGFTGHYYHAPSGLHLALYRAYDADSGRWLSRDPIEEEGGLNLYDYVDNNPISIVDPLGLDGISGPGSGNPANVTPALELQAEAEGYPSVESYLQAQAQRKAAEEAARAAERTLLNAAKKCKLNLNSPNSRLILNNRAKTVEQFMNEFCQGGAKSCPNLPKGVDIAKMSVEDALKNSTLRKLITQARFR